MSKHEMIDGPIEETAYFQENPHVGHANLARLVIDELFEYTKGDHMRQKYGEDPAQTPQLISWVEYRESRFGHALLFSKPDMLPKIGSHMLTGHLYHVDRENHEVLDEPKAIHLPRTPQLFLVDQIKGITRDFDRTDLEYMLAMLKKHRNLVPDPSILDVDGHVLLAMKNLQATKEDEPSESDSVFENEQLFEAAVRTVDCGESGEQAQDRLELHYAKVIDGRLHTVQIEHTLDGLPILYIGATHDKGWVYESHDYNNDSDRQELPHSTATWDLDVILDVMQPINEVPADAIKELMSKRFQPI
jgi:hypothetical protein